LRIGLGVRGAGLRRESVVSTGGTARAVGALMILVAPAAYWLARLNMAHVHSGNRLAVALLVGLGAAIGYTGLNVVRRGRRLGTRRYSVAEALEGHWPVLYLRSFVADPATHAVRPVWAGGVPVNLDGEEELLTSVLRDAFGPVLAIGDPGDVLPELGAARIYGTDLTNWKPLVEKKIAAATHVCLRLGNGAGVRWELEQCLRKLRRERLVLLVPRASDEFVDIRDLLHRHVPLLDHYRPSGMFASRNTIAAIVWFDPTGTPHLEALTRRATDIFTSDRSPLRRAFARVPGSKVKWAA